MTRVVGIGECMVERRADGVEAFAGDAFNVAAHIKQCAPDVRVDWASVTGDGADSRRVRAAWHRFGVGDSLCPAISGGRIGAYWIETDESGERRFSYDRADSAARRWFMELASRAEDMTGADLVFLSGIGLAILPEEQRLAALEFVVGLKPGLLAFDPNVRPALWESPGSMRTVLEAAMAMADILLPSLDDLVQLWGDAPALALLERCRAMGATEIALTLGARGCLIAANGARPKRLIAPSRTVIDTAGAGDAFGGAYLAARLAKRSPEDAARAGLARAALVVARRGALPMELFPCR